ncbi:hypothetical protein [Aquimarina longa]|uniref:hypothetical protein n=1 Tax=Aquimarina longa TaxID=1080221 RepID=UPI0007805D5B|nr:hypothetical protein [Aquimarina longa]
MSTMNNPDYTNLVKVELIDLLKKRDIQVKKQVEELEKVKKNANENVIKYEAKIKNIQKELTECQNSDTAISLIDRLIKLPKTETQKLPFLMRTTNNGIKGFIAFNYGM